MEMRAGGTAGASAERDLLALLYFVAFLHQKFREMQIERQKALAVVDDNAVAFEEQRPREDHLAAIDGRDWGSRVRSKIKALMSSFDRTVKYTLDPEDFGDFSFDWRRRMSPATRDQG